jgi:hypothetical protein
MPFRAFDADMAAEMGTAFATAWSELERSGKLDGQDAQSARERLAHIVMNLKIEAKGMDTESLAVAAIEKFNAPRFDQSFHAGSLAQIPGRSKA